ncbi:DUF3592 domain-containing protein [Deinococcus sp. RM]|uniref:DUF3592 domain-containing protein n=1 Tax=Deinococcus sp. RM TaxID=2316359 RepID=UPI000E6836AB|nr:DUF3592 domain-containing protein [Deinococcus sp. RM]RIY15634.1 DUF3592 domain-containing protein [Deinococcus sp. RM]
MLRVASALRYVLPGILFLITLVSTLLRTPSPELWQWVHSLLLGAAGIGFIGHGVLILTGRVPPSPARPTTRRTTGGFAPVLFIGCWLLFLSALFLNAGRTVVTALRSQSWPQASALITQADYVGRSCDLSYTYAVKGASFTGHRTGWATSPGNRQGDVDCVALRDQPRPQVGEMIQVAYNPVDPAQAVYRTTVPPTTTFMLVALFPFLVMSVWWLRMVWRDAVNPEQ